MTSDNLRADLDAVSEVTSIEVVPLSNTLPTDRESPRRQRIGLGRGLGDLLPSDETDLVPSHLKSAAPREQEIARVALVESASGVNVEIEDDAGVVCLTRVADGGSTDDAVIRGAVELVGAAGEPDIDVSDVATAGGPVVVVTAIREGERGVGATFVEFGRHFALARATLAALRNL